MGLLKRQMRSSAASPEAAVSAGQGYTALKQANARLAALQLLTQDYSISTMPVLGNIHRNDLRFIWNGSDYNEFRRQFHSASMPGCCRNCNYVISKPKSEFLSKLDAGATSR